MHSNHAATSAKDKNRFWIPDSSGMTGWLRARRPRLYPLIPSSVQR